MFLSTMKILPFEGHNVAYQCNGLDLSNIACEYDVIHWLMTLLQKSKTMLNVKVIWRSRS